MYSTTPYMFDASTRPGFEALTQRVRIPLFGCDCYAYGASGVWGCFPTLFCTFRLCLPHFRFTSRLAGKWLLRHGV